MDILINFLATYLIFIFPLIGAYFFFIKKDRILILKMLLAFVVERILEFLIKTAYFTPRPYMVNHLPTYVTITPIDSSFPSGHTMVAFALATVIFRKNKKLGMILFVLAGLIGIGRVMANVHYPIDIISGLILGVTIGTFCDKIKPYARRHHTSPRRKKAR